MMFHRAGSLGWLRTVSSAAVSFAAVSFAAVISTMGCSSDDAPDDEVGDDGRVSALISAADVCDTSLFCETFDALPVDTVPSGVWTTNQNQGTVRVDGTRAYSAGQAVKATTPATEIAYKAALFGYRDPAVLPTANNAHFGRLMFFLESAPEDAVHWTFLAGAGRSAPQEGYPMGYEVLYRYGGQKPVAGGSQLMASYETPGFYSTPPTGPDTDCHQDSAGVPMPVGRWACAEWHFDGATSEMQLWIDGADIAGLHVIGKGTRCRTLADDAPWIPPVFSRIDMGWESYQPDVERAIWIDDFVLGTERIGCPAAP
jgi:hypothetical protein